MSAPKNLQEKGLVKVHSEEVGPESRLRIDGPTIVVTGAYCSNGHNLIDTSSDGPSFVGFPGIKVKVKHNGTQADVILSPIHGDHSKHCTLALTPGMRCDVVCPECQTALPRLASCDCPQGGELVTLYLSSKLDKGTYAAVCNIWGCHRSRIVDAFTLISEFMEEGL